MQYWRNGWAYQLDVGIVQNIFIVPFLREISLSVSVLYFQEFKKGVAESSTMFDREWEFWSDIAKALLNRGMVSITLRSGVTEKKFADPAFEYISLFQGIKEWSPILFVSLWHNKQIDWSLWRTGEGKKLFLCVLPLRLLAYTFQNWGGPFESGDLANDDEDYDIVVAVSKILAQRSTPKEKGWVELHTWNMKWIWNVFRFSY